jgi:leucyl/phenylalanyl-tRNA--protein transferase
VYNLIKGSFHVTIDTAFDQVIHSCAQVRIQKREGTWIIKEMIDAYVKLHESGYAHSVEAWYEGALAGGLYGVSLGNCFFGESMFTRVSNASKVAFVTLVDYLKSMAFDLIDCQVPTAHLIRFGARKIPRTQFLELLQKSLTAPTRRGPWSLTNLIHNG